MAEILFYHLTETKLEETLPQLLEKSIARGWRVCIHCGSQSGMEDLDNHLWTYRDDSFLAHGMASDGNADKQPILLTTSSESANNAEVRFVVELGDEPNAQECERIVYMFDGHDQKQLERARGQWSVCSDKGMDKTYWQQTPDRRWVKKA